MTLKEKRNKLLKEWLKPRKDACEQEMFKQVFNEIKKQDKELIRELKDACNKRHYFKNADCEFCMKKGIIDKLTGDLE